MNLIKVNTKKLIEKKKTYPSWTTDSIYEIKAQENGNNTLVYYITKNNKKISRIFPKEINLTPKFIYILGILRGEGSTSIGKSNYRRFTITNSNPKIINMILKELDKSNMLKKSNIINKSIHLLHYTKSKEEVINYWSRNLRFSEDKFKCFNDKRKTSSYGVCHIYISDVLLRRVIDIIHDKFLLFL